LKFYSTNNKNKEFSLREAVLKGLPDDNGLFMPEWIPVLPIEFFKSMRGKSIAELAETVTGTFLEDDIPKDKLHEICMEAFNFPVPLIGLGTKTFVAELFHGPTLAFKDFGARFMARLMSYLNRNEKKELTILVATSGDTGGAVADGFYGVEGIRVFILYPSGGVSDLQEKQLTTHGKNISAIEIEGTFDDCQRLVKTAFLDKELSSAYRLTSANSINISRLIPQSVYYFSSFASCPDENPNKVFVVPSGNFGNLTAGLIASRMGLPVEHFVAATNVNDTVPEYLGGRGFHPKKSVATISNAMDVGNPSNFGRMLDLYKHSLEEMESEISAYVITDDATRAEMKVIYDKYGYIADPHGAVGIAAWEHYRLDHPDATGIILETAHPAKFLDTVESALNIKIDLPPALETLKSKKKIATRLSSEFESLKEYLLGI